MDSTTLTIIGIVIAIVGIAVAAVVGLIPLAWDQIEKWRAKRVRIFRVKTRKSPLAKDILALFRDKFPDEYLEGGGLSDDFVREVLDAQMPGKRSAETENFFLIALLGNELVGFLYAPYYSSHRLAMISYFGIKGGVSLDYNTAEELIVKLKKILRRRNCKTVYFETQKRGLSKVFVKLVAERAVDVRMRRYDFEYLAAPVTANASSAPANLFGIGLREEIPDFVTKPRMLEILRFLYYEVYGDHYEITDHENFALHHRKLQELVKHFEQKLPEMVVTYPAETESSQGKARSSRIRNAATRKKVPATS